MAPASLLRTVYLAIPWAMSFAYVERLVRAYPRVPPKFAVHFNLRGTPDGWASPATFTTISALTMLLVLASTSIAILQLPASLFHHAVPPIAIAVATGGTGLAVGAFGEILRLARQPTDSPRLRWSTLAFWAALGPTLDLLANLLVH